MARLHDLPAEIIIDIARMATLDLAFRCDGRPDGAYKPCEGCPDCIPGRTERIAGLASANRHFARILRPLIRRTVVIRSDERVLAMLARGSDFLHHVRRLSAVVVASRGPLTDTGLSLLAPACPQLHFLRVTVEASSCRDIAALGPFTVSTGASASLITSLQLRGPYSGQPGLPIEVLVRLAVALPNLEDLGFAFLSGPFNRDWVPVPPFTLKRLAICGALPDKLLHWLLTHDPVLHELQLEGDINVEGWYDNLSAVAKVDVLVLFCCNGEFCNDLCDIFARLGGLGAWARPQEIHFRLGLFDHQALNRLDAFSPILRVYDCFMWDSVFLTLLRTCRPGATFGRNVEEIHVAVETDSPSLMHKRTAARFLYFMSKVDVARPDYSESIDADAPRPVARMIALFIVEISRYRRVTIDLIDKNATITLSFAKGGEPLSEAAATLHAIWAADLSHSDDTDEYNSDSSFERRAHKLQDAGEDPAGYSNDDLAEDDDDDFWDSPGEDEPFDGEVGVDDL